MTTKMPLNFGGKMPPNFDVKANLELAKNYAATHTKEEVENWFNHMVRNNKDEHLPQNISWDFKQLKINSCSGKFNFDYRLKNPLNLVCQCVEAANKWIWRNIA